MTTHNPLNPLNTNSDATRRAFLKASAVAAAGAAAGPAGAGNESLTPAGSPPVAQPPGKDPYTLAARFNKHLRVTDVTDGLDALGRAEKCILDRAIRPLWMGMRFFGPALTMRVIPSHRPMPILDRKDALRQHGIWRQMGGWHAELNPHLKKGCAIVMSTSGAPECGYWGSNNSLDMMARGVAGIVTDGFARDTDEIILQKCSVACRGIGRTIIPGRVELMDVQVPIGCGGVMVRPGDIIGCDWDGLCVIPIEIAEEVLAIAARIAVDDKKIRRRLYDKLGKTPDETVNWESAAEDFKDLL